MPFIAPHALPCPKCGYDLRATPLSPDGLRCPECGTLSTPRAPTPSALPWLHRRAKGRIRTFITTSLLTLFTPWKLARELSSPARPKDARRFRLISLLLAAPITVSFFQFAHSQGHRDYVWIPEELDSFELHPSVVLTDRWFSFLPQLPAAFLATWIAAALYQSLLSLGGTPRDLGGLRFTRRRLKTVTFYAAGQVILQCALLPAVWCAWIDWTIPFYRSHTRPAPLFPITLSALALTLYLYVTLLFIHRVGRWKILRSLLSLLYLPVAYALWMIVFTTFNWLVGYILLAISST